MTSLTTPVEHRWQSAYRVGGWLRAAWPLLLLVAAFVAWGVTHLQPFEFGTDEGPYLMWTRLVRDGYRMYRDIWSDHPPGIVWTLSALFYLVGESIEAARFLSVLVSAVGLLAVGGIAWLAAGRLAGVAAAALLALAPLFNWYGRAVMPDGPANCLAAAALALAMISGRSPLLLAALSGVVFGASLMIKLVTAPLAPVVLVALVTRHASWRQAVGPLVVWGLSVLAVVVLAFLPVDASLAWRLIVDTVAAAREAKPWEFEVWLEVVQDFLVEGHRGLVPLAALGALACLLQPRRERWLVMAWALVASLAVLFHSPLFDHHLVLPLFPLTALGGIAVAQLARGWRWRVAVIVALALYAATLPRVMELTWRATGNQEANNWRMLALVKERTEPDDWIITDNVVLAFRAGLRVPPFIAYPGAKRLSAGLLPDEVWIRQVAEWQPPVIAFLRTAGQQSRAAFLRWVDHSHILAERQSATRRLWSPAPGGPRITLTPVPLDQGIVFQGYSLARPSATPGESLRLGLFWSSPQPLEGGYAVRVRLLGAGDRVLAEDSGPLVNPSEERWAYARGDWTLETRTISLPATMPRGDYALEVTLLNPAAQPVAAPARLAAAVRVE